MGSSARKEKGVLKSTESALARKWRFEPMVFKEFKPDLILHLAGQTTVVSSILNPREDFEVNALGTFNVLEATRNITPKASLIYASTNAS
ncbi:MAG: GDP-mannose 4,6-dehydratase [Patescibacteria group bacterium]